MSKFLIIIAILSATLLMACASGRDSIPTGKAAASISPAPIANQSFDSTTSLGLRGAEGAAAPAMPMGAPEFPGEIENLSSEKAVFSMADDADQALGGISDGGDGAATSTLQTTQRRVISTASLSIEVELVESAIDQVRTIAESVGGFVEHLSSFGNGEDQQANMTLRVPQEQFTNAVERIEDLGEVQNRNLGSEDVSEQFIDLEARLKSALRQEESLLSLLERANVVGEILTIERELTRIRSEIERVQGRLNFLERRVDLATISVSLFPPGKRLPQPPAANMTIEESKVSDRVSAVKNLIDTLDGEIDQVFLSTSNGQERADITFRVFPKDFAQAVTFLEGQGSIISKEIREGSTFKNEGETPKEPNARIAITYLEPESSRMKLILLIGVPIVAVLVAIGLATSFYLTYQAGRNRRDRFVTT